MSTPIANPRRCLLFVPGSRPERYEKAIATGADQVCIDLEDAVAPGDKESARASLFAFLAGTPESQGEIGLRINPLSTALGQADLAALAASGLKPAFVMLPKVETAAELAQADQALAAIDQVAKLIAQAKNPIFLLGLMASQPENSAALRRLLEASHIPVTSTYQAAGAVNQDNFSRFAGRVGLFNNQAGDRLLQLADLVICIGYSPVEYEPAMWNSGNATLVHIDVLPAYEERNYTPDVELVGDIAGTLNKLAQNIDRRLVLSPQAAEILRDRQHQRELLDRRGAQLNQFALHPLRIVRAMQDIVNSDVTLTVDMGSFHIWIARYLYSFRARQVMISNGQQTMGVALPWAIGAWLVNPERKVVSVSGDGGWVAQ